MTYEQFCYWLQGYFEISDHLTMTPTQTQVIVGHLKKVFNKDPYVQPSMPDFKTGSDSILLNDVTPVHYSEHYPSC